MRASGEQYAIEAAGYSAVVTEVGGSLRELRHAGRDLVAGFGAEEIRPFFRGALLAPWPNRIADGRYEFAGRRYQLALTEPDRNNALHGLATWASWTLVDRDASRVALAHRLYPQDGYPFRLDLSASYELGSAGLHCRLGAVNEGDSDAPYGSASHSYLVAGPGRVDDWTFELDAESYLEVTPDRLLPVHLAEVAGSRYDFRTAQKIGDVFIDNAFTGFTRDSGGAARARLLADDGRGVEMTWDASCSWAQVHTADRPEREYNRTGLAVEPMTCPPDAFNSGTGLVVLAPGEHHEISWTIAAI